MSGFRMDRRFLVLLYVLAFVLLREWLIPVMDLTDTNYLWVFLLFIALAFLLALVGAKWWIAVPVKMMYVIWVIHFIYLDQVLFSKETVRYLWQDLLANVPMIMTGDWYGITNPLKTVLFFSLLWMTTYLIRHWIEVRKSILLFYMMTVVFIAFIDTFSPYSADASIFRIMMTGLLLLGLLFISRLVEKHNASLSTRAVVTISLPLLFVVALSGTFASILPKAGPIWPDPIPYLTFMVQGEGEGGTGTGAGISQSGYDSDDSTLGGSFVQDDTVVFEAKVAKKQYWKIETKNTYTSKGWEQVSSDDTQLAYASGMDMVALVERHRQMGDEALNASLQVTEDFPFIVYPYGINKAYAGEDVLFLYSEETGKYSTEIAGSEGALRSYEIDFKEPEYSLTALRATRMEDYSTVGENFSAYLQLPKQLPERVKELARSITEGQESVYDKAKAIERYFGRSGFVYTQQGVPIPKADEDYVDQFLFDTKMGYCDNFSTSMVVMLRALDIPARWVKGFAPGESTINEAGERVYQVTNNEAHSWVEAYMPGIGWMPFEPTIGFSNLTDIEYDIELDLEDSETPDMKEPEQPEKEQVEQPVHEEKRFEVGNYFNAVGLWIRDNVWQSVIGVLMLAFIGWKLFVARVKWLPRVLVQVHQSKQGDWQTFEKQYKSLLKQLDRFGLKRTIGMTLSDYAVNVDSYFGGDKMKVLTAAYEKGLYGGNTTDHEWVSLQEMWKDLINRTSG